VGFCEVAGGGRVVASHSEGVIDHRCRGQSTADHYMLLFI